jgi:hypothetical protein
MELLDPHVVKNQAEFSAVTPLATYLLFPIPVNLYMLPNPVKCDREKSKFFCLRSKKFSAFIQKAGGNSEALI